MGEALAKRFHEVYERLAPGYGYKTREDTKVFDPNTPNGRLMTAVCEEIMSDVKELVYVVDGMCDSYRDENYGDVKEWARHVNNAYSKYQESIDK